MQNAFWTMARLVENAEIIRDPPFLVRVQERKGLKPSEGYQLCLNIKVLYLGGGGGGDYP